MAHKLLLADDSVTIQRVIELTFADEDVVVTAVGDGQLAIERLDAERFDIVLADVDMPKRDGYEVAAYVKSRPKLAHIPVVLLTGAFEPIDQARANAAGSSDVLAKPFEPQMVINRVKNLLGRKKDDEGLGEALPEMAQDFSLKGPQSQPGSMPAGPGEPLSPASPVSLDDYFDQLDAAFSSLQPGAPAPEHDLTNSGNGGKDWPGTQPAVQELRPLVPAPPPVRQVDPPAPPVGSVAPAAVPARPVADAPQQPAARPAAYVPPTPISVTREPVAPPPPIAPAPEPWQHAASQMPVRPVPPAATPAPPPPAPPTVVVKPVASGPALNPFASLTAARAEAAARPPAPVVTEEMIEDIVSRVLERMTDRVVRETVTEIVTRTAEQAVQHEIEKIKSGS